MFMTRHRKRFLLIIVSTAILLFWFYIRGIGREYGATVSIGNNSIWFMSMEGVFVFTMQSYSSTMIKQRIEGNNFIGLETFNQALSGVEPMMPIPPDYPYVHSWHTGKARVTQFSVAFYQLYGFAIVVAAIAYGPRRLCARPR